MNICLYNNYRCPFCRFELTEKETIITQINLMSEVIIHSNDDNFKKETTDYINKLKEIYEL
jgi:hypothetical protein